MQSIYHIAFKETCLKHQQIIKIIELQAERLKKEQDALQKEQWRLEDLEEERKKMESARGQREMG